jgi:hypothetical protein
MRPRPPDRRRRPARAELPATLRLPDAAAPPLRPRDGAAQRRIARRLTEPIWNVRSGTSRSPRQPPTQGSSWRLVRTPSASMRNRPCIARPRHLERLHVRLGEKHIGLLGIDPNNQVALTAGRNRHLAADEEDEASEHRLLADVGLAGDQLTNAIGEIFVVCHAGIIVSRRRKRPPRLPFRAICERLLTVVSDDRLRRRPGAPDKIVSGCASPGRSERPSDRVADAPGSSVATVADALLKTQR